MGVAHFSVSHPCSAEPFVLSPRLRRLARRNVARSLGFLHDDARTSEMRCRLLLQGAVARAGFRSDGTLMAALVANGWDGSDRDRSASWFVALGPRAMKPTRVQRLVVDGAASGAFPNLALRVGPGGRATVAVDLPRDGGTGLFEGTARGLRRVPGFQARHAASTALGTLADGRGMAVWNRRTTDGEPALLFSAQGKTRSYSPSTPLPESPIVPEDVEEVTAVAGLQDGRLATSWRATGDSLARNRSFVLLAPVPSRR